MSSQLRSLLLCSILLLSAVAPGLGQNTGTPRVVPKLEAIAETKLIMEGLAHANFRGLERNLSKDAIDDQSWVFARGQALLIAESANLMMLRPPKSPAETAWMERCMDLRSQAQQMAVTLAKKDLGRAKAGMTQLANSCNQCHRTFRVPVEITPFPQAQPEVAPPIRKVQRGAERRDQTD